MQPSFDFDMIVFVCFPFIFFFLLLLKKKKKRGGGGGGGGRGGGAAYSFCFVYYHVVFLFISSFSVCKFFFSNTNVFSLTLSSLMIRKSSILHSPSGILLISADRDACHFFSLSLGCLSQRTPQNT